MRQRVKDGAPMPDSERPYLQTAEQWTQFLSAVSHELRTPLASLRMLAELLIEKRPDHLEAPERRYAEGIQKVVSDLNGFVGDFAEFARMLADRVQLHPVNVRLRELAEEVTAVVRPKARERGIVVTESLDVAPSTTFRTDLDLLRRPLTSLLEGAVGNAASEVFFRLSLDDGELRVIISSDGTPFPVTAAEIFEPLGEGSRTSRQHGGRSLALSLARETARTLGGKLEAGNRGGRPTFDLSLPAARP